MRRPRRVADVGAVRPRRHDVVLVERGHRKQQRRIGEIARRAIDRCELVADHGNVRRDAIRATGKQRRAIGEAARHGERLQGLRSDGEHAARDRRPGRAALHLDDDIRGHRAIDVRHRERVRATERVRVDRVIDAADGRAVVGGLLAWRHAVVVAGVRHAVAVVVDAVGAHLGGAGMNRRILVVAIAGVGRVAIAIAVGGADVVVPACIGPTRADEDQQADRCLPHHACVFAQTQTYSYGGFWRLHVIRSAIGDRAAEVVCPTEEAAGDDQAAWVLLRGGQGLDGIAGSFATRPMRPVASAK